MFEVGFTEIILILGIALLVLGPENFPSSRTRSAAGPAAPARWRGSFASSSTRK